MPRAADSDVLKHAYHEAGHAVMAVITGCLLAEVRLSPDGGHAPLSSRFHGSRPDREEITTKTRAMMEAEYMTAIAGGMAQWRFSGKRPQQHETEDDARLAYDEKMHRLNLRPAEEWAYQRYLWERVRSELLLDPRAWYAVYCVAGELAEKQRLSWRRVRAIVSTAMGSEDAPSLGRKRRLAR